MPKSKFSGPVTSIALALLLAGTIALARLRIWTLGWLRRAVTRDAAEVAKYLYDHSAGRDGLWDWHEFLSIPIVDENLDQIRKRAISIDINTVTGRADLRRLIAEASTQAQASARTQFLL